MYVYMYIYVFIYVYIYILYITYVSRIKECHFPSALKIRLCSHVTEPFKNLNRSGKYTNHQT